MLLTLPSSSRNSRSKATQPPPSKDELLDDLEIESDDDLVIDEEIEARMVQLWKNTLVGYVLEGKPFREQAIFEALQYKKEGGNRKNSRDSRQFQNILNQCNLLDLGSKGPLFTWSNRRKGTANIIIKLDRSIANPMWRTNYSNVVVFVKPVIQSDHNPILIDTKGGVSKGTRPFRFEKVRIRHPNCEELEEELPREEVMWHQKYKLEWIQSGDRNSTFFYATTVQRRQHNHILKLKIGSGRWNEFKEEIFEELLKHFREASTSQAVIITKVQQALNSVHPIVSNDLNDLLYRAPSMEEMHQAVSAMGPLKAPRPDVFPPSFYQHFWDFTKEDLFQFVLNFFSTGHLAEEMNKTYICLIPKT
ncbi:uncharacterized protein LOC122643361 [Telopea speciosissima]|uniref:uncharacterized protein LOC122643361 n=1 Tax=Telopea speciosissima TaxID=54955 RepID=UPI001CC5A688|nr:uncharacterized protein LOC122643361 [Telopea speciosissima]